MKRSPRFWAHLLRRSRLLAASVMRVDAVNINRDAVANVDSINVDSVSVDKTGPLTTSEQALLRYQIGARWT